MTGLLYRDEAYDPADLKGSVMLIFWAGHSYFSVLSIQRVLLRESMNVMCFVLIVC